MLNGHALATFSQTTARLVPPIPAHLPWRRTRIPIASGFRKSCSSKPASPPRSRITSDFWSASRTFTRLAAAPPKEVLRLWPGLVTTAARRPAKKPRIKIIAKHAGQFPTEWMRPLHGRHRKLTAAAILSTAFGEKHAVLDATSRASLRDSAHSRRPREPQRWKICKIDGSLARPKSPGDWNQAMMNLRDGVHPKSPAMPALGRRTIPVRRSWHRQSPLTRKTEESRHGEVPGPAGILGWKRADSSSFRLEKYKRESLGRSRADRWFREGIPNALGDPETSGRKLIAISTNSFQGSRPQMASRSGGKVRHAVSVPRHHPSCPSSINVKKLPRVPGARAIAAR